MKLSDADFEAIKKAVKEAEASVSGEIVPVIVQRSSNYNSASYKGALLAIFITFIIVIVVHRPLESAFTLTPSLLFFIVVIAAIVGGLLPYYLNDVKRVLISRAHVERATRMRAESIFLEEEVFSTRHRTGILIFISRLEREVIILADRGISKVVEQRRWDKIANDLIVSLKNGDAVQGLISAIKKCHELLFENGFYKEKTDVNELSDHLRVD